MPPLSAPLIVSSLAFATATTYALLTYTQLHRASLSSRIISAKHVSSSLDSSTTVTKLINPNGFRSWGDSRSVVLRVPSAQVKATNDGQALTQRREKANSLGDEEILARFTRGFFGGWVFAPERAALKMLGVALKAGVVRFPKRGADMTPKDIWMTSEISDRRLPNIDTVFFGAFQVVDKYILPPPNHSNLSNAEETEEEESYIDLAYGSKDSSFAGVHRFSVAGRRIVDGDETVRVTLACVTCNPKKDGTVLPGWAWGFHRAYAMLLFREGVAAVAR